METVQYVGAWLNKHPHFILEIGIVISTLGLMITTLALLTNWIISWINNRNKNSEFFLIQIQAYFKNAVDLLSHERNDNILWHGAINSLESVIDLSEKITHAAHEIIYVTEYIDAVYKIVHILAKIESLKFFYGTLDYKEKDSKELFLVSNSVKSYSEKADEEPKDGDVIFNFPRISPEGLSFLCRFLDKPNLFYVKETLNESFSMKEKFKEFSKPISKQVLDSSEEQIYKSKFQRIVLYIKNHKFHKNFQLDYWVEERKKAKNS
jgi:hypothetical protein